MKRKLRILLLEDNDVDAELIAHELKSAGFDFQLERIQSEASLRRKLQTERPDLIISDHGLPSFNGFRALEIVRDQSFDLPFIFVSGSNHQGMVSRMYEGGATDYVFKKDLQDLSPAVRQALMPFSSPAVEVQRMKPQPLIMTSTRLWLCPSCFYARAEQGIAVDFLEYFRTHSEIVLRHEVCVACRSK